MPVCELRHATTEDTDSVYALICELLKNELDYQAFRDGFAANLLDPNVHYRLALRNGEVVGMISLHMQFHLHHANWIGEFRSWWYHRRCGDKKLAVSFWPGQKKKHVRLAPS